MCAFNNEGMFVRALFKGCFTGWLCFGEARGLKCLKIIKFTVYNTRNDIRGGYGGGPGSNAVLIVDVLSGLKAV